MIAACVFEGIYTNNAFDYLEDRLEVVAVELAKNKEHRESYDLCVSRAVANLSTLSEYCLPFIKKGGYFLSYKGPDSGQEVKDAKNAISILGGKIEREEIASIDSFDLEHKIIFIKKKQLIF